MRAPVFALTLALLTFTACKESWTLGDGDGDGVLVTSGDCDDNNAEVNPDATEVWYNGVDENCDGNDADQDGDTFVDAAYVTAFPDWQTRFPLHAGFTEGDCWDDPDDGSFLEEAVLNGLTLTPDLVSPNAEDAWYDGVDQNCDGANDFDQDGDGFDSANDERVDGSVGDDCVDGSANDEVFEDSCSGELITVDLADAASVNPDATDTFYDGIDQNCDGADDNDADGDGYAVCNECDDTDPETFPSDIPEIWYDCADQNCDGNDGDRDGDGYVDAAYTASCADWATINPGKQDGDCWDDITDSDPDFTAINGNPKLSHADVHPDAEDIPYDAVDAACDGDTYEFDADQDGFDTDAEANRDNERGDDCHDDIAAANPDATEECDAEDIDHDCDGNLNDPSALGCVTFYVDVDKDTYGITTSQCLCEAEGTYTASNNDDCDDTKSTINPGATEGVGDSVDSNCDNGESCYTDADNDGYRDSASTVLTSSDTDCNDSGEATNTDLTGDCNDSNSAISPGDPEICDSSNTDEDCDGKADNDDSGATGTTRYYKDADSDTYGATSDTGALRCDADTTYKVTNNTDCNDSNSSINTAATEIAGDEVDQNCNSTETCYKDSDNDGYRPDSTSTVSSSDTDCVDSGEAKSSEPTTDCDDTNASRYPTNTEITGDGVDQDCDLKEVCFIDVDNDNYYLSSGTVTSSDTDCSDSGEGSTSDISGDCNDGNSAINAGATEITGDEVDQNCDNKETCYLDDDNDGYRPDSTSTKASTDTDCQDTDEALATDPTGDCNDAVATIYTGATEVIGDGIDQSCDGKETCYKDTDNDGYRPDSSSTVSSSDADCTDSGEALSSDPVGDCDDSEPTANFGATETCDVDDVDEDCDGLADNDDSTATGKVMYYPDVDGDTFGDAEDPGSLLCDTTATYEVADNTDCDDSTSLVRPNRTNDICWDGYDNDCDVAVDEGSASVPCYTGGELVISELFIHGSDGLSAPSREWFEVYNPHATNTVYLESMTITRQNGSAGNVSFTVDEMVAVTKQDTVVFCYDDAYLGSLCDYEYGPSTGINFALTQNAATTLVIATTAGDVSSITIDSVNYDGDTGVAAAPWPGLRAGYSYELKTLTASDNDNGAKWCETTGAAYYTASGSDYGTPNATNTCP
ncbi:MAG: hypothetical protein IPO67_31220 [Deltaproteobacteria bacterium]|nr:hypothetical protein [Deltaproteobacteria bacterium]